MPRWKLTGTSLGSRHGDPGGDRRRLGCDLALLTANMYRNHGGGASHIASASVMVDPAHAGRGAGRALGEDALDWARAEGFRGMQFNAVVETNVRAVGLWRSLGFEVLATLPEGFNHPALGYVGLHIMYRRL